MADLHFLANPARFRRFSPRVQPGLAFATILSLAVGLYLALVQSPPDYQQGETVRIMFVHVPSAWLSMAGYGLLAVLGASLLVWRHPLAGLMAPMVRGPIRTFSVGLPDTDSNELDWARLVAHRVRAVHREFDHAVFTMTIHPDVSGRPQVLLAHERIIEHINAHEGVRWVTFDEIADDHLARHPRSG